MTAFTGLFRVLRVQKTEGIETCVNDRSYVPWLFGHGVGL